MGDQLNAVLSSQPRRRTVHGGVQISVFKLSPTNLKPAPRLKRTASLFTPATTALTSEIPDKLKSAKSDALAFIGSEGEIRGAEFEQASRYYRATYRPPLMSDHQLALAIATSR